MNKRLFNFILALVVFALEVVIAKFTHGFIRGSVGDILVVILIGATVRVIFPEKFKHLCLYIFCFSVIIETLQYFEFLKIINLDKFPFLVLIFGGTFSFGDILCYAIGAVIFAFIDRVFDRIENLKEES